LQDLLFVVVFLLQRGRIRFPTPYEIAHGTVRPDFPPLSEAALEARKGIEREAQRLDRIANRKKREERERQAKEEKERLTREEKAKAKTEL
jgi:hypothetical protein